MIAYYYNYNIHHHLNQKNIPTCYKMAQNLNPWQCKILSI